MAKSSLLKPNKLTQLKTVAPIIPYLAVIIGLSGLESAWGSILLYHCGIVLVLWLARYWRLGEPLKTRTDYLILTTVAVASLLGGVLIFWLWPFMKLGALLLVSELANLGLSSTAWLLFMAYYVTINPVLEELFWRGYLGSDSAFPTWNDVWFAGYHILVLIRFVTVPWIVASFLILVSAAWLWRQLAHRYQGLIMPIASHAAADLSIIAAVFFLLRLAE